MLYSLGSKNIIIIIIIIIIINTLQYRRRMPALALWNQPLGWVY
jgi:hypothetical protein